MYVVHRAPMLHNVRVDPALTVTDFYTNDTVKSVFLDYVAALLAHPSSTSGLPLRHDPLIAGWQLAEAPAHPGHKGSQQLLVRDGYTHPCSAALVACVSELPFLCAAPVSKLPADHG